MSDRCLGTQDLDVQQLVHDNRNVGNLCRYDTCSNTQADIQKYIYSYKEIVIMFALAHENNK